MPTLKIKSDGYVGFRHFIIAGVAMPILVAIVVGLVFGFAATAAGIPGFLSLFAIPFVPTIMQSIAVILGAWYSGHHLTRKFVISSPIKIANIATVWFACFEVIVFLIWPYFSGSFSQATSFTDGPVMAVIDVIVVSAVFYVASKALIKSNSASQSV